MPVKNPGIWIATLVILVAGAAILFLMGNGDRNRQSDLEGTSIGQSAATLTATLGQSPTECPVGDLRHLGESFGAGWSPASVDVALERLAAETDARWVYPVGSRAPSCDGGVRQTEVGVDAAGNVVWWIAVLGRSALQVPASVTPAGVDSVEATGV